MRLIIPILAVAALAGCGVDTMGAAATAAALKKQEIEQGRKTMELYQQKMNEAMKQAEQRSQQAADDAVLPPADQTIARP